VQPIERLQYLQRLQASFQELINGPDRSIFLAEMPHKRPRAVLARVALSLDLQVLRLLARATDDPEERRKAYRMIREAHLKTRQELIQMEPITHQRLLDAQPAVGGVN
jgi:hypothetical protein